MSSLQDKIVRNVDTENVEDFLYDVGQEFYNSRKNFGPSASLHEAFGVLMEEIHELERKIETKISSRSEYIERHNEIVGEAVQASAVLMALALENRPDAIPWFWNGEYSEQGDNDARLEGEPEGDPNDWEDPFMQGTGD